MLERSIEEFEAEEITGDSTMSRPLRPRRGADATPAATPADAEHAADDGPGPEDAVGHGRGAGALKSETVEASAGGGMVTVKVSGELEVLELKIDPDAV